MAGRPRSTLRLMLYGLALVVLPLAAALAWVTGQVDHFAGASRAVVAEAVETTRRGGELVAATTRLERLARQYAILEDPELLAAYEGERADFRAVAGGPDGEALRAREAELHQLLRLGEAEPAVVAEGFRALRRAVRTAGREGRERIDERAAALQAEARASRRVVLGSVAAVLALTLLVAALLVRRVNRPISQLDRAIRQLGEGRAEAVAIHGPADLEELGERLEWLRQRLAAADAQKARFLRHVSHELKTPLAGIREGAGLLHDGTTGALTREQSEIAGIIRGNAERLQGLIENLLRFNRLQDDEGRPAPTAETALEAVVAEVIAASEPVRRGRAIELTTDLAPARVPGEAGTLRTVVDNLLSNALKFTPRGGEVRVTLRRGADSAVLEVVDTGPGIPAAEAERIFDAFFRGDTPPPQGGSGLGLAIARESARSLGGELELIPGRGRGSRFRLTLPRKPEGLPPCPETDS
ncbi:MAG: sensor histidine kinase [Thiohalospira sp.]